jgi:hypothetical protein
MIYSLSYLESEFIKDTTYFSHQKILQYLKFYRTINHEYFQVPFKHLKFILINQLLFSMKHFSCITGTNFQEALEQYQTVYLFSLFLLSSTHFI